MLAVETGSLSLHNCPGKQVSDAVIHIKQQSPIRALTGCGKLPSAYDW